MNAEARARIHLNLAPGVGTVEAWRWIQLFGSASAALRAGEEMLLASRARPAAIAAALSRETSEAVERELKLAEKLQIQFLFPPGTSRIRAACVESPGGPGLPPEFTEIEAAPIALRAAGRIELLASNRTRIAIVGARTPTPYGAAQAARFATEIAAAGVVVVSGFARGIDRAAHESALRAGGDTIAVLGSGIADPYPGDRPDLIKTIAARGLFISEFAIEAPALRSNFPRRNRTLAAFAHAVVVVEAGEASGSLITARWAEDLGRCVFAVPGRVDSPMSAGCHRMIQNTSAQLCISPRDVLQKIGVAAEAPAARQSSAPANTNAELELINAAREGATLDELAEHWTGPPDALFEAVLALELAGAIERAPGGIYRAL
ncbi:MAG: DNA-protecting protein DprA [Planctomycetes bacterium]|nr:DNA-protecting protein DprA [Planctomycetota bacterium]